jgi:hypothetical protein
MEDIPGLKWYYGIFLKSFCHEKKYFTIDKVIENIDIGNEPEDDEENDFYELQSFWEKVFSAYISVCKGEEYLDE